MIHEASGLSYNVEAQQLIPTDPETCPATSEP